MRWPWARHPAGGAERIAPAVADAQARLRRAHAQSDAIARRAEEVLAEIEPAEFVSRVARVFRTTHD